ncbi:MAG: inorganic phosphate transporter [Cyclobacteriaceae bacterium]|nr:inorganic phosphate transporter [Cyclobacteriaceae bacterium]
MGNDFLKATTRAMDIFSILILILFGTAIVDLIVGVSNDAVNFLNSAVGSRASSFRTIMIVASLGILLGATFSSGMMEVARNGLFNPGYFTFREVIYIFLAVMLTDIILLDVYNDFGLPTSTTVSLVFELLGSAFVTGILTSLAKGMDWTAIDLGKILNFSSAITIVTGIFLSIFLAFIVGSIIQHISRIVFTFSLNESLRRYGALFSGISITTIVYFLLIKGAKGSSFITDDQVKWVMDNAWIINMVSLVFWSILVQLLMWYTTINPLRIVVLLGTFALAMAFAGNDMVNFIGVAVGGYLAFQSWSVSGTSPDAFNMSVLSERFATPTWILLIAGAIMIITLWTNAKARKVTDTEVSLGRQEEGEEKFKSNWLSRMLVSASIAMGRFVEEFVPRSWSRALSKRFVQPKEAPAKNDKDRPSFDLVRAAVNLLVASVLIAYGTSQKLPLSTTFVTFMVAMGSSFADQAWGRESAVYRVAGVMNVIAGWLITAIVAFVSSGILAFILFKSGTIGVFVLTSVAAFLLVRSHIVFAQREKQEAAVGQVLAGDLESLSQAIDQCKDLTVKNVRLANKAYTTSIDALAKEKKAALAKSLDKIRELRDQNGKLQNKIIKYVKKMPKGNLSASRLYIMMFDYMQDLYQSVQLVSESCADHLENMHELPSKEYMRSASEIEKSLSSYCTLVCSAIGSTSFVHQEGVKQQYDLLAGEIARAIDREIAEIHKGETGNRISLLQVRLLLETKDILTTVNSIYALYHDYHRESK